MTHFEKLNELIFMSAKYKELTTQLTWKYKTLIQQKAEELESLKARTTNEKVGSHPHIMLMIEQAKTLSLIESYTQFLEDLSV